MNVSDWVIGHDTDGYMIKGYVERVDIRDHSAQVRVTESGDGVDRLKGKVRWAHQRHLRVLDVSNMTDTEGYLRNLIDFALDIGDELWFRELTTELRKLKYPESDLRTITIETRFSV